VTDPTTLQTAMRAVEAAVLPPSRPAAPRVAGTGFDDLKAVLDEAFRQSAEGKGAERHGRGVPFNRQPILEIQRMVGPGFAMGQAAKKASEAAGMVARGDREAACRELLGTIVYAAAAIIAIRELP
jgi:hypothetical protein